MKTVKKPIKTTAKTKITPQKIKVAGVLYEKVPEKIKVGGKIYTLVATK